MVTSPKRGVPSFSLRSPHPPPLPCVPRVSVNPLVGLHGTPHFEDGRHCVLSGVLIAPGKGEERVCSSCPLPTIAATTKTVFLCSWPFSLVLPPDHFCWTHCFQCVCRGCGATCCSKCAKVVLCVVLIGVSRSDGFRWPLSGVGVTVASPQVGRSASHRDESFHALDDS